MGETVFSFAAMLDSRVAISLAFVVVAIYVVRHFTVNRGQVPPGPKGWPIIGNVLDMPTSNQTRVFTEWGKRWGDIISLSVLGQRIVILNSVQHMTELFDKKSAIYSDRPTLVFAGEFVGWKRMVFMQSYGNAFREQRKYMHHAMGTRQHVAKYAPVLEEHARRLLLHVLQEPADPMKHISRMTAAIMLQVTYGYRVEDSEDPLVHLVDSVSKQFTTSATPGTYLVDVFPILRYVPSWMPGTGWKRTAKEYAVRFEEMCGVPFDYVKRQMANGMAASSFVSLNLSKGDVDAEKESMIKYVAASLYLAGSETTASSILGFVLAMTLHPEAQKKAQQEIDAVIGRDRFPTITDSPQLPYTTALYLEVLRWIAPANLGMAHRVKEDNFSAGYYIPAGTLVIANHRNMLHDPRVYSEPSEFRPERFIASDNTPPEADPRDASFSAGRRACAGIHLAEAMIFGTIGHILATFDIAKAVEDGKTIEPVVQFSTDTISRLSPFKCSIKPRSAATEAMIRSFEDTN